jgi:mono/diheme cytochrome c family protein
MIAPMARLRGLVVALGAAALLLGLQIVAAQGTRRTIWDGVYTDAQARRGQDAYVKACGYCHRDDLSGGGSDAGAPALIGPIFEHRWRGLALSDMFLTIGTTMPQNAPDSMTPQAVIDVVSFLLKASGAPTGAAELPPELEKLKEILVTEKPTASRP